MIAVVAAEKMDAADGDAMDAVVAVLLRVGSFDAAAAVAMGDLKIRFAGCYAVHRSPDSVMKWCFAVK